MKWDRKVNNQRYELFNLKNIECQKLFKDATTIANNKSFLSSVFEENVDKG